MRGTVDPLSNRNAALAYRHAPRHRRRPRRNRQPRLRLARGGNARRAGGHGNRRLQRLRPRRRRRQRRLGPETEVIHLHLVGASHLCPRTSVRYRVISPQGQRSGSRGRPGPGTRPPLCTLRLPTMARAWRVVRLRMLPVLAIAEWSLCCLSLCCLYCRRFKRCPNVWRFVARWFTNARCGRMSSPAITRQEWIARS
jgi:hypothetical protein